LANLADRTAKEFKEKDYKNDFYKKIIDKRLEAWEYAERFAEFISVARQDNDSKELTYDYFLDGETFVKVKEDLISLTAKAFWISDGYLAAIQDFSAKLNEVVEECIFFEEGMVTEVTYAKVDNLKLANAGKKYYLEFNLLVEKITSAQSTMLKTLHDIESFLAEKG